MSSFGGGGVIINFVVILYVLLFTLHCTWWIHEVKVHQIVDAQLLQLQHDRPQVGAKDLGVCVVLHLILVSLLSVESEALSRLCSTGTTGPLLCTGLGDG